MLVTSVQFFFANFSKFLSLTDDGSGSHVIHVLQKTRQYKVISIDNHHNAYPESLVRVAQLAKDALPQNPTQSDINSTIIDTYACDLTKPAQVRHVFEQYGSGGIWGVIHIAVSLVNFINDRS